MCYSLGAFNKMTGLTVMDLFLVIKPFSMHYILV